MVITKENIQFYIPQRAPFIMIDNLIEATGKSFKTDFLILADNIFVEDEVLKEFALIENIAQSSSAGLAVTTFSAGSKTVDGFIGGISKLKLFELPGVNETIYTVITLLARLENMFLVKGENFINGRKLLECEMKLVGI